MRVADSEDQTHAHFEKWEGAGAYTLQNLAGLKFSNGLSPGELVRSLLRDQLINETIEFGVVKGFIRKMFGVEIPRIDHRKCLIDEDGGVRNKPVAHCFAWKHIGAILADSAHLRI
jgi:hypothetical protein